MKIACPTCLESFTSSCEISSTPCGHVFHTKCIKKWLETSNRNQYCPQCRKSCTITQINKLYFPEALSENEFDNETNLKCIELKDENLKANLKCNELKEENLKANHQLKTSKEENLKMERELYDLKYRESNLKKQFKSELNLLNLCKDQLREKDKRINDLEKK